MKNLTGKTGVYTEDGWMADVEILSDTSDTEWIRFELKVLRTHHKPRMFQAPEDGHVFECSRLVGICYGGMWRLMIGGETI